ncbi:MAG: hypothetical protein IH975_10975 [Nitrospinae bacterium]|nr:hypothetical protein [Nitrospinota bacterium]
MRKLATLIAVAGLVVAFGVVTTTQAIAKPKRKFGRLKAPKDEIWLIHHYDNRTGDFSGAPVFEDSGETKFRGKIGGVGKATVEQSAAWTWTTYQQDGAGRCALVYDITNPRTLERIHTHQGVTTDPNGNDISGDLPITPGDFGTHEFTGTVKITKKSGATINGEILGGTNCEVKIFPIDEPLHDAPPWDFDHSDTRNTVTTVFKITGGTKKFAGIKGDGVLVFTYDTDEPHTLLDAHITIFKFK